ncbi:uncharacterized protein LOC109798537 [Cajanus cajan]|nr:uncharacterized protein LOC109798537 [Cajanus cajan]
MVWVSWNKINMSKEEGGLGIKRLDLFNDALLEKWRWKLFHELNSLWGRVLVSKYGVRATIKEGSLTNKMSLWWSDIMLASGGENNSNWFMDAVTWKIRDGKRTRFWFDSWITDEPLVMRFSRIFSVSTQQHNLVYNMGYWSSRRW